MFAPTGGHSFDATHDHLQRPCLNTAKPERGHPQWPSRHVPRTQAVLPHKQTSGPSDRRSPTLDVTLWCHRRYSPGAMHSPTDPTHGTSRLSGTATAQRTDRARASGTVTPRSNPPGLSAPYHLTRTTLVKPRPDDHKIRYLRTSSPSKNSPFTMPRHHCRGRSQPNQVLRTVYR